MPGPIDDPVKCKARVWSYPPPPRIFRGNPVRRSMVRKNRVKVRLRIQFLEGRGLVVLVLVGLITRILVFLQSDVPRWYC